MIAAPLMRKYRPWSSEPCCDAAAATYAGSVSLPVTRATVRKPSIRDTLTAPAAAVTLVYDVQGRVSLPKHGTYRTHITALLTEVRPGLVRLDLEGAALLDDHGATHALRRLPRAPPP